MPAEMGDAEPGTVRPAIGEHGIQFGLADDAVVIEIAGGKGTTKALNRLKSYGPIYVVPPAPTGCGGDREFRPIRHI